MEAAQGKRVGGERVSLGRLLLVGPLAAIAAVAANAVVYFVAVALGATPQGFVIEGNGGPLGLQQVMVASVLGAVERRRCSRSSLFWRDGGGRSWLSGSWRPWYSRSLA